MDLEKRLARFAPVALTVDQARLDERQRSLARRLIQAGRLLDEVYLRQVWSGNPDLRDKLSGSGQSEDRLRLRLFGLMGGPWDRFSGDTIVPGVPSRPSGAGFYPQDLAKAEFEAWLEQHPADRDAFVNYFTVIERHQADALKAVPYHKAYREWLEPAAEALSDAAALADYGPLSDYLEMRAQALLDDDYFDSDCAWVELQAGPFEVVFGPYEVYEDRLFGYKAAYEAVVAVRDMGESARFKELVDYLPILAANLPVLREHQGEVAGLASPIVVVDTIYNAGQTAVVGIPIAFVLPNDRRVRTAVGTKKVMLKNICEAKFNQIVLSIGERLLDGEQAAALDFAPNFAHILLHEVSHALGAQQVRGADGATVPVHEPLQDHYSTLEECKADIVGLYNILFLADQGFFPREWRELVPITYLANMFRVTRRGASGAHARGNLLAFNFLWEAGAIRQDASSGRFRIYPDRAAPAVGELAAILLRIEGEGNYGGAQSLVDRYVHLPDVLAKAYVGLDDIPLDLAPTYPWAEGLCT